MIRVVNDKKALDQFLRVGGAVTSKWGLSMAADGTPQRKWGRTAPPPTAGSPSATGLTMSPPCLPPSRALSTRHTVRYHNGAAGTICKKLSILLLLLLLLADVE